MIAGGRDKGSDYTPLREAIDGKIKALVLIGEAAELLRSTLGDMVPTTMAVSMMDAMVKAFDIADADDTVLLSPATSSFDMFKNYEERGDAFAQAVREASKTESLNQQP